MSEPLPSGYQVPLHAAITQPVLFFGVPRTMGIIGLTFTLAVSLGLKVWFIGLPLGIAVHVVAVVLTRIDPYWFDVFRDHIKQPSHLDA